jgi:hypothetical protein
MLLVVRTFACIVADADSTASIQLWIFAADESRARELARRELANATSAERAEVYEDGKLLFVEYASVEPQATHRGAGSTP